ncbi:MAG TPA: response regulator [Beijerinckiaceae bacterium]|nr:response regulator [Beijerinckiaceae bacterium]
MSAPDRLRILIVEDEFLIAIDLADLVADFGHEVCAIASTADEALAAAIRFLPDVVLTDIQLAQGSSGLDAAKRIRVALGIPSFFISGSIDRALMEKAQESAPLGFFSKPFEPRALQSALAQAAACCAAH